MPNYLVSDTQLTGIANAIRAKSGGTSPLVFPDGFVSEVSGIQGFTVQTKSGSTTLATRIFPGDSIPLVVSVYLGNYISDTPVQVTNYSLTRGNADGLIVFLKSISASGAYATVNVELYNSTATSISDTFSIYVSVKCLSPN